MFYHLYCGPYNVILPKNKTQGSYESLYIYLIFSLWLLNALVYYAQEKLELQYKHTL